MKKMMRVSRIIDTWVKVTQILWWIVSVMAVLCTLFLTCLVFFFPNIPPELGMTEFQLGQVSFEFSPEYARSFGWLVAQLWLMLPIMPIGVLYHRWIRRILQPMKEGRPFDRGIGENIRKIGYATLAFGIANNLLRFFDTFSVMQVFRDGDIHISGALESITVGYSPDLSCLIAFLVLLLISHIFNYGAELQRQSDETL